MRKALVIALAMGLASLFAVPAGAQQTEAEPTVVPAVVNIEDPAGDANYLNGQGLEDEGDQTTPADASSVADILKVWFSHDQDVIRAHILTEVPPPATASAYFFRVTADASGDTNCLWFQIATTGPTNPTATEVTGSLRDLCGDANETFTEGITATIEETADGQGISTVTVPRATHPALGDNLILGAPRAQARNFLGVVTAPQVDDTRAGTDYTIAPPPAEKPLKKGCTKGSIKAKKKGCKK